MNEEEDKDYEVGYGKPPKHTRFKKGKSGNSKGRPKGRKNTDRILRSLMDKKVSVRENGTTRELPLSEALVLRLFEKALNGNMSDQLKLLKFVDEHAPDLLKGEQQPLTIITEYVLPPGKTPEDYEN
jgi:hypothetical protein